MARPGLLAEGLAGRSHKRLAICPLPPGFGNGGLLKASGPVILQRWIDSGLAFSGGAKIHYRIGNPEGSLNLSGNVNRLR
jgi:hypothetical protein